MLDDDDYDIDEDDELIKEISCEDYSAEPAVTVRVVHSREKLHWIDRVLGVRDVSTDMDDPDECS